MLYEELWYRRWTSYLINLSLWRTYKFLISIFAGSDGGNRRCICLEQYLLSSWWSLGSETWIDTLGCRSANCGDARTLVIHLKHLSSIHLKADVNPNENHQPYIYHSWGRYGCQYVGLQTRCTMFKNTSGGQKRKRSPQSICQLEWYACYIDKWSFSLVMFTDDRSFCQPFEPNSHLWLSGMAAQGWATHEICWEVAKSFSGWHLACQDAARTRTLNRDALCQRHRKRSCQVLASRSVWSLILDIIIFFNLTQPLLVIQMLSSSFQYSHGLISPLTPHLDPWTDPRTSLWKIRVMLCTWSDWDRQEQQRSERMSSQESKKRYRQSRGLTTSWVRG